MRPITATALPSGQSWEQFLELLDQDEYLNAELIDGQVVVSTPSWLHQRIVKNLLCAVESWIRSGRGRGEVTFNPPVRKLATP
jgi:Uma2 family endonuclease